MQAKTVVTLTKKEVVDALAEKAKTACPNANGGTEVQLEPDGTAIVSFQFSGRVK